MYILLLTAYTHCLLKLWQNRELKYYTDVKRIKLLQKSIWIFTCMYIPSYIISFKGMYSSAGRDKK